MLEISDVVCLLNHTYLRFGAKRILEEMSALERLPAGFIEAFRAVADVETIEQARAACHTLITLVSGFLSEVEREIVPRPVPAEFAGLYEEISAHWNKIRLSCENGDAINAFLSAASLQDELDRVQRCLGIDITEMRFVDRYNPNSLVEFAQAAQKAEDAFLTLLCDSGVPISSYTTVDQFKHALMDL